MTGPSDTLEYQPRSPASGKSRAAGFLLCLAAVQLLITLTFAGVYAGIALGSLIQLDQLPSHDAPNSVQFPVYGRLGTALAYAGFTALILLPITIIAAAVNRMYLRRYSRLTVLVAILSFLLLVGTVIFDPLRVLEWMRD